jgi:3',5'-cyclic AMP phosphodiesterase CpdA
MLLAQITDLHLGFSSDAPDELNTQRLKATLKAIFAGPVRPDALLVSGDLSEGKVVSYRRLKAILSDVPAPVHIALGNHDHRAAFREVFPEAPDAGGFVQYAVEDAPVRLLVLDTLDEGRNGGAFCAARAAWLAERLAESDRPTLLALHHPPVETGIEWMEVGAQEGWVRRLAEAVAGHDHILGLVCGHMHRPIATTWRGLPVSVCAATAPQLALDLTPLDPDVPDGRALIVDEPPAFALHRITSAGLLTHFAAVTPAPVVARFDDRMQPLIRFLAAERQEPS